MKKAILFALLLIGTGSFAQKLTELDEMLNSIKPLESKTLELQNERKSTYDILMNYTTDKTVRPYPQLGMILDSMKLQGEEIAELRRELGREKDAILESAGGGKIKKKTEAHERLSMVIEVKDELNERVKNYAGKNETYSKQFDNLIMLNNISITTYGDYYEEFLSEVQNRENQLVDQGSKLGALRARLGEENDTEAQTEEFQDVIHELNSIHRNAQSKITLIQNFQSRLETTRPDELIVIAPAVPPPYEINLMVKELDALDEYFSAFDMFHGELNE